MQDIVKHIVTGGYWKDKSTRRWVQAGSEICKDMERQASFLGYRPEKSLTVGVLMYR